MPELALKIGDSATYEDGDIVDAFNARRIRRVHAEMLCHPKRNRALAEVFAGETREYKFERVSNTEVRRTNLLTNESDVLSDRPNSNGEQIKVSLFLARRKACPRHLIFGDVGAERWYGGVAAYSDDVMDRVWAAIETQTRHRENTFRRWPFSEGELKQFLVLPVDDFTDLAREEYKAPLLQEQNGQVVQVKRRKHGVDWRKGLGLSAKEVADVVDGGKPVDLRASKQPFGREGIVRVKKAKLAGEL